MNLRPGRLVVSSIVAVALVSIGYAAGLQSSRSGSIRIQPIAERDLTAEQREILGSYASGRMLSLFGICVKAPEMCRAWVGVSRYFGKSALSAHDRELLIMRTCWLTRNEYTWGNHVGGAKRAGFSDEDLVRISKGPQAGWSGFDLALMQAADALHAEQVIPETTWKALSARYGDREMQDLLFVVGQYTYVAMWARSAGLPLEPNAPAFPK